MGMKTMTMGLPKTEVEVPWILRPVLLRICRNQGQENEAQRTNPLGLIQPVKGSMKLPKSQANVPKAQQRAGKLVRVKLKELLSAHLSGGFELSSIPKSLNHACYIEMISVKIQS